MNYGFEIYVDRNQIKLAENLLQPLAASPGTTLYGMHYPLPGKDQQILYDKKEPSTKADYTYATSDHDLVITTIPFDLWPACIAGRLDIRHKNGRLKSVLLALKEYGLNVLYLRCIRAGHRYATVSFVAHLVGFGTNDGTKVDAGGKSDILNRVLSIRRREWEDAKLKIPNEKSNREELIDYIKRLREEARVIQRCLIRRLGSKELLEDIKDIPVAETIAARAEEYQYSTLEPEGILMWETPFDRRGVDIWALKNLTYFHAFMHNEKSRSTVTRFTAQVTEDRSIVFNDPDELSILTDLDNDLPSVGFASLDSDAYIIRLAILRPEHHRSFRAIDLDYRFLASAERDISIGALHDLVKSVSDDWNIWRVYNKGARYEPGRNGKFGFSRGRISFIMEYRPDSSPSRGSANKMPSDSDLRDAILKAVSFSEFKIVKPIRVRQFTSRKIFISIKPIDQLDRSEEIIELCKEIGSEFGFLPENVRTVDDYGSNSVSKEVARTLKDSAGFIQFLMIDNSDGDFTWLESELFHATNLGLRTVRIVDPRLRHKIRMFQDKAALFLSEFASRRRFELTIRQAYKHIIEGISDTGKPTGCSD